MTRALRMPLRAIGQIGILATTVNMTVLTAGLFVSRLVYAHGGGERDDPWQPSWLQRRYDLPESIVLGVLAAGLLYGLMRRHHPVPDAAGRASATWRLVALIVPTYVVSLVGMASTRGGPLDREIVATTILVAILAAVVGCHLLSRRRIQLKRTRA